MDIFAIGEHGGMGDIIRGQASVPRGLLRTIDRVPHGCVLLNPSFVNQSCPGNRYECFKICPILIVSERGFFVFTRPHINRRRTANPYSRSLSRVIKDTTISVANANGIVTIPGWLNGAIASAGSSPYTFA
ncbi:hypothetical protein Poly51_11460 [Rubripirellula tenax]|uniref:Uncharacterized protein n=1 Tax=Rubripirellula tenax TaxID=2528015 RepID=A0A5C6FM09_9BACT|nr:hypothetical protein Poly51_11460 [Rubripirellula tenax]